MREHALRTSDSVSSRQCITACDEVSYEFEARDDGDRLARPRGPVTIVERTHRRRVTAPLPVNLPNEATVEDVKQILTKPSFSSQDVQNLGIAAVLARLLGKNGADAAPSKLDELVEDARHLAGEDVHPG